MNAVCLEFSKAFDTDSYNILIDKQKYNQWDWLKTGELQDCKEWWDSWRLTAGQLVWCTTGVDITYLDPQMLNNFINYLNNVHVVIGY